jgi:hypothetical protein
MAGKDGKVPKLTAIPRRQCSLDVVVLKLAIVAVVDMRALTSMPKICHIYISALCVGYYADRQSRAEQYSSCRSTLKDVARLKQAM